MRSFDESRIYLVLEFFTSHFLEMAKKSNEYRNKGQSYLYMQAAKNLLRILDVIKQKSLKLHTFHWSTISQSECRKGGTYGRTYILSDQAW